MKILVTGASGYLGNIVVEELSKKGIDIVAVTRDKSKIKKENMQLNNVNWIEVDICKIDQYNIGNLDMIVHLAAQSSPNGINLESYINDNILATQTLIQFAKDNHVHDILYTSSLSVYGKIDDEEVNENTDIINPDNYGMTKYLAENLLKESGLNTLVVRLPGIVGRDAKKPWLCRIINNLKINQDVNIFNPENKFNNLVYANDFASLIFELLKNKKIKSFDVVTMSCSGYKNILSLVRDIQRLLNSKSEINIEVNTNKSFIISNKKLIEKYGFVPMDINKILQEICI